VVDKDFSSRLINYYKKNILLTDDVSVEIARLQNPLIMDVEGVRFSAISGFNPSQEYYVEDLVKEVKCFDVNKIINVYRSDALDISIRLLEGNFDFYITPRFVEHDIVCCLKINDELTVLNPYIFG
jgi:hypothetical protein